MSSAAANDSDEHEVPPVKPEKSAAIILFMIAADTTWRMFVPIIGGAALGIWADRSFGTKPAWTVTGISIGVVIAALLVRQQLKRKPNVI